MRTLFTIFCSAMVLMVLTACATPPGSYRFTATTPDGKPVTGSITTDLRGLPDARTTICMEHPGATIKIVDANTGQELAGQSPYRCP